MITVNSWFFHTGRSPIGPLHFQRIDRLRSSETKMNRGGVLSIEGIAGDDGQKLTFFASNHCDDSPKYAKTVANLKQRLASLRKCIGDDGRDFPGTEKVVQEFWNYDAADREKARKISGEFLQQRLQALKASPKRKKK